MLLSTLSLLLASASALPAITPVGQSSDRLTVQINLDQVPKPASTRCEQLCDQGDVYCQKDCTNDECKAVCTFEAGMCKMNCMWTPPPLPPKDGNGNEYCIPTCMEGYYICTHERFVMVECIYQYDVCRAKCKTDID